MCVWHLGFRMTKRVFWNSYLIKEKKRIIRTAIHIRSSVFSYLIILSPLLLKLFVLMLPSLQIPINSHPLRNTCQTHFRTTIIYQVCCEAFGDLLVTPAGMLQIPSYLIYHVSELRRLNKCSLNLNEYILLCNILIRITLLWDLLFSPFMYTHAIIIKGTCTELNVNKPFVFINLDCIGLKFLY